MSALESKDLQCLDVDDLSEQTKQEYRVASHRKKKKGPTWPPHTPAIITLDSLNSKHAGTIKILKSYIIEEAADKRGNMQVEPSQMQGLAAKGLPQQKNWYDCGLYTLLYFEKLLENPGIFTKQLLRRELDEDRDWKPVDTVEMRNDIRETLLSLGKQQEDKRKKEKSARRTQKHSETAATAFMSAGIPTGPEVQGAAGEEGSRQDAVTIFDDVKDLPDESRPATRAEALRSAASVDEVVYAHSHDERPQLEQAASDQADPMETAREPGKGDGKAPYRHRLAANTSRPDVSKSDEQILQISPSAEEKSRATETKSPFFPTRDFPSHTVEDKQRPLGQKRNAEGKRANYSRKNNRQNPHQTTWLKADDVIEIPD